MAAASSVEPADATLAVALADGRTIVVPLAWYPRLLNGTVEERGRWRVIDGGRGLNWPDLDEDIRVEDLLAGRPSGESQSSLRRWLEHGADGRKTVAATQRFLPENLETITVSSLMDDERVHVVAWAIVADEEGRLWIDGDRSFTREPSGTSHVSITRLGDTIVVTKDSIGDHAHERRPPRPGGRFLLVTLKS